MKTLLFLIFILGAINTGLAQDKKIDKLEVLYSQKHYTKVIRKSNKLLAIPDYDYSGMPGFYKSLALFKLSNNPDWAPKHKNSLNEAINLYSTFLNHNKSDVYVKSHYFEIVELKQFLLNFESQLIKNYQQSKANTLGKFIKNNLNNIKTSGVKIDKPNQISQKIKNKNNTKKPQTKENNNLDIRDQIVASSYQYIGVPYQWAGTSPNGFDCSGFVGYIFKNNGILIPRSAAAQKEHAVKIKTNEATKGDLVFFSSGSKITHVGLVISSKNEPLTMIHSSSSKGIIKTNIETSTYWRKKLAGAGRFVQ